MTRLASPLRVGGAVVLATAMAVGPAGPGLPAPPTPVAHAGEQWCEYDPVQLIRTDDGRLLPAVVFYTPGGQVRSLLDLPRILSLLPGTLLKVNSSSQPVPGGTQVRLRVTIPAGAGPPYATRLLVSQGVAGTLTAYAEVYGWSGQEMVAQFVLPAR